MLKKEEENCFNDLGKPDKIVALLIDIHYLWIRLILYSSCVNDPTLKLVSFKGIWFFVSVIDTKYEFLQYAVSFTSAC